MPLKISGVDVAKVLVGSGGESPAQKIMLGTGSSAVQVWQAIRQVTITATYISGSGYRWSIPAVGDEELLTLLQSNAARFAARVTCNRVSIVAGVNQPAGTEIGTNQTVLPISSGTYIFTEVTS